MYNEYIMQNTGVVCVGMATEEKTANDESCTKNGVKRLLGMHREPCLVIS